jgi:hypothetical protein
MLPDQLQRPALWRAVNHLLLPLTLQVSLFDIMPPMCVGDLTKLCEEHSRR